ERACASFQPSIYSSEIIDTVLKQRDWLGKQSLSEDPDQSKQECHAHKHGEEASWQGLTPVFGIERENEDAPTGQTDHPDPVVMRGSRMRFGHGVVKKPAHKGG